MNTCDHREKRTVETRFYAESRYTVETCENCKETLILDSINGGHITTSQILPLIRRSRQNSKANICARMRFSRKQAQP